MKLVRCWIAGALCVGLAGCGGGGGGGSPPPPAPVVTATLTANPTSVVSGGTVTLTWASTNAASCAASGGWSGVKTTSGSEASGALTSNTTFTITCGGATSSANVTVTQPVPVAVSGKLLVPGNTQTDSDTNDSYDTSLPPVRNNTFATAQPLPNPIMVGGYVTEPGAGESGPLQAGGDEDDVYSVSLVKDQIIELTVANPNPDVDDLDLQLYPSNQLNTPITSMGINRVEQLVVPTTGQYFIRVYAYQGASNYILSIGQPGSRAIVSMLGQDFVPGELLVKMRDAGSGAQKPQFAAKSMDLDVVHEAQGMHSLLRMRSSTAATLEKLRPGIGAKLGRVGDPDEMEQLKQRTLVARKELSKRSDVEWVEPNWILRATRTPNDPLYERQRWHYEQMQLPSAWEITTGSANVIAAVVDTGVRPHEELATQLVDQYDFVDDDTNAADPGVSAQGTYYFHGTHVAGTIAASGNDSKGVTGVAWTSKIMPVRVLGANGSGTFDDIIQGVAYAARLTNSSGRLPATRADVINLSLGGAGACPAAMQQVVTAARAAGSIIVAAAGNENTSTPSTPAACNGVISVSALDTRRQRAPYSNFGDTVDVAAPGGDMSADRDGDGYSDGIYSTHASRNGTTYTASHTYMQGTSMAAPHVAGVVVLMRSVNPAITPAQIDTFLANGALTDDIGTPGRDSLGIGAINALKAVRAASTNPPAVLPRLDAVPSSLSLGDSGTTNEIVVSNGGAGAITVTGTVSSAPWLTVAPVAPVDANGLGRYRIDVNRAGLANGTYQGTVTFNSNPAPTPPATATVVSVLIQVSSTPAVSNAGQHYLLLIDPTSGEPKYQIEVLARGSTVDFNFPSVTPGRYQLSVGTDANNDNFICDDGEACGQYPVYGEPRDIDATSAVTGLQITTNYRTDVAPAAASTETVERKGHQRLR